MEESTIHQYPRPPSLLWRMKHHFIRHIWPWLQAGQPCNDTSQRAPWPGCGPVWQSIHPFSHAQQPPHFCRLRREYAKGKSGQVQSHNSHSGHTTARGHVTEGWLPDRWPLGEWYWKCSRYARREHICQVPFRKYTRKVSAGGRTGKEEYVLGCMPPTTPKLLSLRFLRQCTDGCGGDGYPEKDSQSPRKKVAKP